MNTEKTLLENENPTLSKADVIGSACVWNAPENSDASRVLALHAFIPKQRGKWYEDKYEGNKSLCGRIGIANESERFITISEIDNEKFDETKACKQCVRIARQRHYL